LALILAFGFAGETLAYFSPVTLPASVLGLTLMLVCLGIKLIKPDQLGETADFLSGNMAFFFLPAAVTILQNLETIRPWVWQLLLICLVCSVFTFFVSYGTVRILRMILLRRN
jgi:holin-like protein